MTPKELYTTAVCLETMSVAFDLVTEIDIVTEALNLTDYILATVKLDDDEPITPEWLSQVGETNQHGAIFFGEYLHISEGSWSVGHCQLHDMMTPDTRGDLRALCRMVKHELPEVTA